MPANLSHMTWAEFVRQTIGGDQQVEAARKAGLDQTTISRWVRGGQAGKAENVVKLARAYGASVLEALVVAGFIRVDEARAQVTINRFEDPSDERLLELLASRLRRDREEVVDRGDRPAPMTEGSPDPAPSNVTSLRPDESVDPYKTGQAKAARKRPKPPTE